MPQIRPHVTLWSHCYSLPFSVLFQLFFFSYGIPFSHRRGVIFIFSWPPPLPSHGTRVNYYLYMFTFSRLTPLTTQLPHPMESNQVYSNGHWFENGVLAVVADEPGPSVKTVKDLDELTCRHAHQYAANRPRPVAVTRATRKITRTVSHKLALRMGNICKQRVSENIYKELLYRACTPAWY